MKPVRILVAMFAVVAFVPIWLVRAGDQTEANLGLAPSELARREPFPDRSFADIPTEMEEAPTGRLTVGVGREPDNRKPLAFFGNLSIRRSRGVARSIRNGRPKFFHRIAGSQLTRYPARRCGCARKPTKRV